MPIKNLILFYCGLRTGQFGQGTFIQSLLPYFKSRPDITVTLIKTDADDIAAISHDKEGDMEIIAIPRIQKTAVLTGENNPMQKAYARRIIGIIYPYLKDKTDLLFWVNSIDYLNLSYELKNVFDQCKLMYVHHSFSWKYFVNVPDRVFVNEWEKGNDLFHPKAFEMTKYQKAMATVSDIVITVTDHANGFFVNVLGIPAYKVVTIYNGSPVPINKQESKQGLRKKYGFANTEKVILFSGRITKHKGFPDLLKAFKLVADKNKKAKLVVIGSGEILNYASLVEPHWSRIVYTGKLDRLQVSDFYRLADIGVIPSLHEQCSFTAIEMRLHKLPVIVSGVDGLDELFTHERDSLKLPMHLNKAGERAIDEREFAGYIERLIYDEKISGSITNNSYQEGIKMFTSEVMWENYEKMLASILY